MDSSKATEESLEASIERAKKSPYYAASWLDQSINPVLADGIQPGDEAFANDPTKLVLNVRFTDGLSAAEQELRSMWGGALCVSSAEHTSAELETIQQSFDPDQVVSSDIDTARGVVYVKLIAADPDLQADYNDRYGPGTVAITSWLQPIS